MDMQNTGYRNSGTPAVVLTIGSETRLASCILNQPSVGRNAELLYQAEDDRVHRIVIDDPFGEIGGYTLTLEPEHSPPGE